jgi:hypothetical protein
MKSCVPTLCLTSLLAAACGQATQTGAPAAGTAAQPGSSSVASVMTAGVAAPASVSAPPPATSAAGNGAAVSTTPATPSTAVAAPSGGAGGVTSVAGSTATPPTAGSAGAAVAASDPPGTVTLTTESFVLKAGQETYKCQNFDNPFGNKDTALQQMSTDMSPGSHHLHVYHMTTSSSRTLEDCTIQDFHPLLFASGGPHNSVTYPPGMAAKLLGTAGIRIQVHYLNVSDKDLTVKAVLKLTPGDYGSVKQWVSELYFNQLSLKVPPGSGQTVTTTCAIPKTFGTIGLVYGGTHMHKRGVHFTAMTSTGVKLADVDTWDEPPPITYDPPVMLNPGDSITWTCTYDNTTTKTLMFGESAEDNEMCIYLARFFSDPDGSQLECQAMGPTGTTSTRTY